MLTRRALRTLSTAHGTQREMRDVEIWRKTQHTCFIFLHSFFVFYKFWNWFQFIHGLNLDLYVTLISFFLLLAIPLKSLFLGLKDSRRNRKGKERKKKRWLMWNRKVFDKKRYKSFLFPLLQIWTNQRLKIFYASCLKSQFILRFLTQPI